MCSQYYYIHAASQTLHNQGQITSVMQTSCIKGEVSTMDRLKNSQTSLGQIQVPELNRW